VEGEPADSLDAARFAKDDDIVSTTLTVTTTAITEALSTIARRVFISEYVTLEKTSGAGREKEVTLTTGHFSRPQIVSLFPPLSPHLVSE
jgi:hypothetical protein